MFRRRGFATVQLVQRRFQRTEVTIQRCCCSLTNSTAFASLDSGIAVRGCRQRFHSYLRLLRCNSVPCGVVNTGTSRRLLSVDSSDSLDDDSTAIDDEYLPSRLRRGERADSVSAEELEDRQRHAIRIDNYDGPTEGLVKHLKRVRLGRYRGWANQRLKDQRSDESALPDRVPGSAKVLHEDYLSTHATLRSREPLWSSVLPEIAVIGYSNCGKSSTINALCGARRADDDARSSFAAVSARAGWTTGIKWIELESETRGPFCLVDMPGYGDAVATDKERTAWISGVNRYFKNSQQLRACVVLVDATRGVATHDLRTLKLLQRLKVPTFVALTKADLLRPEELAASHNIIRDDVAGFQNVVTSSFGNLSGGQQDAQTKEEEETNGFVSHTMVSARHLQGIPELWMDLMEELRPESTLKKDGDANDVTHRDWDDEEQAETQRRSERYSSEALDSRVDQLLRRAKLERHQRSPPQ